MSTAQLNSPIALDISAINPNFRESHVTRGIGRYVGQLLSELSQLEGYRDLVSTFDHCELLANSKISALIDYLPCGRVTARQQILYPFVLNSKKFEQVKLLHFPAHMDAAAWGLKPYILTVLDLIPLILKDLYAPEVFNWRFRLARYLELRAIKGAQHIIAISQTTADDVHRLLGVPYERITVTPLGVDQKFFDVGQTPIDLAAASALRQKLGILTQAPVLLYVGGIDQRKNIPQLLKLHAQLVSRAKERASVTPVLVMVGSIKSDKNFPALQALIKELKIESDVVLAGYLTDQELALIYRISSLFCFLSLYEGFGLPPLEAMAVGLPVLCSNRSCLPEVVGRGGMLVDPDDIDQLVLNAERVLLDSEYAQSLSRLGVIQAKKFTWKHTAEGTLAVYQKLLAKG